jgi:hypothetical protein
MMSSMSFVTGSYPFYISFYAVETHLGSLSVSTSLLFGFRGGEFYEESVVSLVARDNVQDIGLVRSTHHVRDFGRLDPSQSQVTMRRKFPFSWFLVLYNCGICYYAITTTCLMYSHS